MDVKQYRDNGELSDFTVYVEKERFKLHKFPLFTKSEFFKEVTLSNPVCELTEFPGGGKTFAIIADFCYGKDIRITASNVALLNAGAEKLRMKGKNNLIVVTRNHMDELFSKAVSEQEYLALISIICTLSSLNSKETEKGLDDALRLLESAWVPNSSPFFGKTQSSRSDTSGYNAGVEDFMVFLPLPQMKRVIEDTGLDGPNGQSCYRLIGKYLGRILDHYVAAKELMDKRSKSSSKNQDSEDTSSKKEKVKKTDKDLVPNKHCQPKMSVGMNDQMELEKLYEDESALRESLTKPTEQFDTLFEFIPEENELAEFISPEWIKQAVLLVDTGSSRPKCRTKVMKLAYSMLQKLSDEELNEMPTSTMRELINAHDKPAQRQSQVEMLTSSRRASRRISGIDQPLGSTDEGGDLSRRMSTRRESALGDGNKDANADVKPLPEEVTPKMITYMDKRADEKSLTVNDFLGIVRKLDCKGDDGNTQDRLLELLNKLRQSDRELTEQEKSEFMERIDLSKCSADSLAKVLEAELLPPKPVAEAAIQVAKNKNEHSVHFDRNAYREADHLASSPTFTSDKDNLPFSVSSYQPAISGSSYTSPYSTGLSNQTWRPQRPIGCSTSTAIKPYSSYSSEPKLSGSAFKPSVSYGSAFKPSASYGGSGFKSSSHVLSKPSYRPSAYYSGPTVRQPMTNSSRADTYRRCPELEQTDRLLDMFEEEMRRELKDLTSRAHTNTMLRCRSPLY